MSEPKPGQRRPDGPERKPRRDVILRLDEDGGRGQSRALADLRREGGTPRCLSASGAWEVLSRLLGPGGSPPSDWPDRDRDLAGDLARFALRFSRPDGSAVFGPPGANPGLAGLLARLADGLDDPGLATVARWWFGGRGAPAPGAPPPLPAFGFPDRPMAMLRADWAKDGDALAVDGRDPSRPMIELMVGGRPILGPDWPGAEGPSSLKVWKTGALADCAEWTARASGARIVRTAVFLRGRKMALLAEQRRGEGDQSPAESRLLPALNSAARPILGTHALALKGGKTGPTVQVIPLSVTDTGDGTLVMGSEGIRQVAGRPSSRPWLAWLFCWDPERTRRPPSVRELTVSERSKVCRPGVAIASRVSWGPGASVVIYRSLTRPAPRTFLGHQTSTRFLLGLFTESGDVSPLLALDD